MTMGQNPDADQVLDEVARLVREGDHAGARILCEQALAQSPQDADVLIWLARIAMDDALWAEAIAAFDRALQIRLDPWSLGNLAMCYCRTGRLKEAEHCLRGAIGLKPDLVRAHVNLAAVLHGLRRFDDALAQLATASALDATDYQIAMRQGNALTELGRFDDAQAAYAQAVRLAGKFCLSADRRVRPDDAGRNHRPPARASRRRACWTKSISTTLIATSC